MTHAPDGIAMHPCQTGAPSNAVSTLRHEVTGSVYVVVQPPAGAAPDGGAAARRVRRGDAAQPAAAQLPALQPVRPGARALSRPCQGFCSNATGLRPHRMPRRCLAGHTRIWSAQQDSASACCCAIMVTHTPGEGKQVAAPGGGGSRTRMCMLKIVTRAGGEAAGEGGARGGDAQRAAAGALPVLFRPHPRGAPGVLRGQGLPAAGRAQGACAWPASALTLHRM